MNLFSILVSIPCRNPGIWGWNTIYRVPDTSCFRLEELSTFCHLKKLSCQRVITVLVADTGLHMAMPSCCLQSNLSFWNYMNLVWKFTSRSFGMWFNQLVSSVQWSWLFQRFCEAHTTVTIGKLVTNELKNNCVKRHDELFILECLHCCEHKVSKAVGRRHHLRNINSFWQHIQWCAAVTCSLKSKCDHNQKTSRREQVS